MRRNGVGLGERLGERLGTRLGTRLGQRLGERLGRRLGRRLGIRLGTLLGRRLGGLLLILGLGIAALDGCSSSSPAAPPAAPTRSYRMGFSDFPPRFDLTSYTNSLAMWLPRADAAITHVAVPWDSLLLGVRADSFVIHHFGNTTSLYRSHGFTIYFVTDVTDGLNRQAEAPSLIALGRSITEPAIQVIYRGYVLAVDTLLHPDYLGLAAETNLIKAGVAPAVYAAVVTMTNAAAADVRAVDAGRKLFVSVQVETAWGRLGNGGAYIGIAQDYADFPFIDAFGLSSYPYLGGYADPADIPDDYYSRLIAGHTTPVMVVEGGWSSGSAGTFVSDPAKQARYLQRHRAVLAAAHAIALFQLDFADFDTTGLGLPPNSTLSLFTQIGIVTADLVPKPALAIWDSTFAWPRVP